MSLSETKNGKDLHLNHRLATSGYNKGYTYFHTELHTFYLISNECNKNEKHCQSVS